MAAGLGLAAEHRRFQFDVGRYALGGGAQYKDLIALFQPGCYCLCRLAFGGIAWCVLETEQAIERALQRNDQLLTINADFQPGFALDMGCVGDCYGQPGRN